jgi:hypothetical protein
MFSPCVEIALVTLFPEKLFHLIWSFLAQVMDFIVASQLKKKKVKVASSASWAFGPVPGSPSSVTRTLAVPGRYRTGSTVTRTVPSWYRAGTALAGPAYPR